MKRVILLLFLFISYFSSAQVYKYISVENGLSSRKVYSIKKDQKGYMWFLTRDGIDRFDGKLFKHYKLTADGVEIRSFVHVSQLYTDTTGCMWEIGKDGQIFKYNSSFDNFQFICKLNKESKDELVLNYAYIDKSNNIWLCTDNKQYIYNIDSHKLHKINIVNNRSIINMVQIDNDTYCMGTPDGVYTAKLKNYKLQPIPQPGLDTLSVQVNAMFYHETAKKLYIGSFLKGLFVYDYTNKRLTNPNTGLQDININCIKALNDKEVLIATDGAGVYKINTQTLESVPYIVANYNIPNGMNGNNINDIYIDDEQRIWMANYPMGITVLNNRYPEYKWIKHSIGNKESLINDQVNSVIEDSAGDIWFATNNGISMYHPPTGTWTNMLSSFHTNTQNKNHIFTTLCEVSPGIIWVGGYTSGMYSINKKEMKPNYFIPLSFRKNIHPDKYIRAIFKDSKDNIWVGGYYYLKRINIKERTMDVFAGVHSINTIIEKDSTHLWIGCLDGLFLMNKQSKKYRQIKLPGESNHINVIYQDKNGILYIGTNGSGLMVYNPKNDKFTIYSRNNSSLVSNSIYSILSDEKGVYLIISTENSLSRFDIKNKSFSNWTSEQGLMTCHFNATSGTYTSKNTFIIGSGDGAVEFNANTNIPKDYSSKLVFSDFRLLYQAVYSGGKDSPLNKDIDEVKTVDLNSNQNIFSLRLSSINYDYPSNVLYSWKLDGFYSEWNKPSTESLIRYTNLIPGRYKLIVRAISKEDQHVIEERELNIIIHPPFWATIWAMLVYICMLTLIAWAVIRYILMKKERKVSTDKINFFVNTAHDIRTPLTLIKAPLDELREHENLSVKGMQNLQMAIRSANNLYGLISNLMDFEKVDMYSDKLHPYEYELDSYIKETVGQYQVLAEAKKIDLKYEGNITPKNVWFDKTKMDTIMRNIISNAIKYTPENGYVNIHASMSKDSWTLEVKDTGIGIPLNEQKKVFNLLFRASNAVSSNIAGSGIGLMLVHRLVHLHGGKITLDSTEGKGSTFTLTFSFNNTKVLKSKQIQKHQEAKQIAVSTESNDVPQITVTPLPEIDQTDESNSTARIVVVEDNPDLRTYLNETLSEKYTIFTAVNGKEGLDMVRYIKPDLVVSDIMMPIMDGDELCKIIKSDIDTSHIPIILLTAKATKEDIIHGLEVKADRYLTKPFEPPILRATIANILENRELLKKRFAQMDLEETDCKNCNSALDFQFMAKVSEIIDKKMAEPSFSVDVLCSDLNMSRTSCYNKIRALTNQSPNDCIKEARLNKAAKLLRLKQHTIMEVADMTGFGDAKYFREVFKRRFKVTPSQYAETVSLSKDEQTEVAKK